MSNLHRERTAQGVTVLVAPGRGPVTVEAWVGGGTGDEDHGGATAGMAHLGEHVALAMAHARSHVGLDGWVTPDATVFRAIAPAGAMPDAVAAIAAIANARAAVSEWVVEREKERIASEHENQARGSAREVAAWWRHSYAPERTTVAVRGGEVDEVVTAIAAGWRTADREARRPARRLRRATRGVDVSRATARERAALAVVAAAMRARGDAADLIVTRDAVTWFAAATSPDVVDGTALAWARAAVRMPVAGVETAVGELAAGQHLFGDPAWGARWRAEVARVTAEDVTRAVRSHLGRHVVRAARRPPVTPRPTAAPRQIKRATLAGGTRVVAVRIPGADRVAVRVTWPGGFAAEGPAERGVVALLAAAVPESCADIDVAAETAALGGELAGVAGRWTFGLRSRWDRAAWKDGLALVAACARAPELDRDVVTRERNRLVALATDVARSPSRMAYLAYLRARWAGTPLAVEALAAPAELAAVSRATAARWWREHYAPGAAVVVIAGDIDPDDAIAHAREQLVAPAGATALRQPPAATAPPLPPVPPMPEARQLFVDGPDGAIALVIGLPGLVAGDADRRALDGLVAILDDPSGRLRRATGAAGVHDVRVSAVDGPSAGFVAIELESARPADGALAAAEAVIRALATDGPTTAEVAVAAAATAPPDEPLAVADAMARTELGLAADNSTPLDAIALQRVAASVLRWDDAFVVTVRPPAMTPGARAHATKRLPPRRSSRTRRGGSR